MSQISQSAPEIPHLHGPDKSTLEIVVRFELLSLDQLLSCVNSRALDEETENLAELDRRPQSMALWKSSDAYGSSVAANPRAFSLSKYLDLATSSRVDVLPQRHVFASPSSAPIFPTSGCGFRSKRRKNFFTRFCGIYL